MDKSTWYRVKACIYFFVYLLASPLCPILTLILWTVGNFIRVFKSGNRFPTPKQLDPALRRTVLVTDTTNTKTLHVLRVLAQAGHRIILVESKQYRHTAASWSKYASHTIFVPHHNGPSRDEYVKAVVKVAIEENVDWFIPVSKTRSGIPNYMVEEKLGKLCPRIRCLGFGDLELSKVLDHKIDFLVLCQKLRLSIPDFRLISGIEDLRRLRNENLFEKRHYFLKPATFCSEDRLNFKRIPNELNAFNEFVKEYEEKFDSDRAYFVCEFIKGSEYASNAICGDGRIFAIQVCPASSANMKYDVVHHPAIREWTIEFCRKMKITGGISFDFIEDNRTKKIYCIECNPRLHTNITSYHYDPQLAIIFQAALEPESIKAEMVRFPVEPPIDSPRVYWLYHELERLFTGRQGPIEFLSTVYHGREAVYTIDDPLPFLIANTVHVLFQLKRGILSGFPWGYINHSTGRLSH